MNYFPHEILYALNHAGHPIFKGDYNLTLVGIRDRDLDANTFNDLLFVTYEVDGKRHHHFFPMTTDPGTYYRLNPINVRGTAVLKPGHYPGCWTLGKHRGQYPALVQKRSMTVYRDGTRDENLVLLSRYQRGGIFGINLHRAGKGRFDFLNVGKWSAGCQVVANEIDFNLLMALLNKSASIYGPDFSYSLIDEGDL